MNINRCISCENEIESYPCSHCGFDISGYSQPECALPFNTILHGRYLIGKVLGQGGFGITYMGWDMALEVKVAIKEYYPNGQVTRSMTNTSLIWYTNPQATELKQSGMETFLREARKMAKVERIPEVVRVRDTFAENETAYIVMDFVEGQTLNSYLKKHGVLSWAETQKIFFPVMSAMGQIHSKGIIHRDLSPDNLMLTPEGDVYILDLGAAKDLSINGGLSSMQVAKSGFSPPEQYTERGGTGSWSDVYALSATMYYALTGVVPPKAIDRLLVSDTVNWDLPQLLALPKVVQVALKKAMEVLAKDRTQSMGELLMQMQNASAGNKQEKPSKEPKPKSEPKSKEGRKSRKKMSRWIPVMVAVLMLVCVVYCVQPVGKTMPTEDQPSQPWLALETPSQPVNRLVACGPNSTVCVTAKDTVLMRGFEKTFPQGGKVRAWKNIVSVSIGETHAIGLRKDGHMVTVGDCNYGTKMTVQYGPSAVVGSPTGEISTNIFDNTVQVEAGNMWTIGLKPDGTVVTAGSESLQEVNTWSNIVAIAAGVDHAVGLKSDGTVVAAGDNFHGKCDVTSWRNIVAISAGRYQTVGLKADGTVVMTGFKDKQDVSSWKNIVAVSAGKYHTVGLMADGTVIATGKNTHHQCEVGSWKNIVAISTGDNHTVGVKSDGTVVATGYNNAGQCDVSAWKNVRISE